MNLHRIGFFFLAYCLTHFVQAQGRATIQGRVIASVANSCTISTSTIYFNNLTNGVPAQLVQNDTNLAITAACSNNYSFTVAADLGLNGSGTQRRMKHSTGAYYINYTLYTDGARTSPTPIGTPVGYLGVGAPQNIDYVRIPAQPVDQIGFYSDTVTMVATF